MDETIEYIPAIPAPCEREQNTRPLLGALLQDKTPLTEIQLQQALSHQQHSGGKLATILTHTGTISPLTCYQTLAAQLQLPFIDLLRTPPAATALHESYMPLYIEHEIVPHHHDGRQWHIATTNPEAVTSARLQQLGITCHTAPQLYITTPYDIRHAIAAYFAPLLTHDATFGLLDAHPDHATHPFRTRPLSLLPFGCAALLIAASVYNPTMMWYLLNAALLCFFTLMLGFKLMLFAVGIAVRHRIFAIGDTSPLISDDHGLPIYSVLVPLFHEAVSIPDIVRTLGALDYPAHKLDIKLIVEEEDSATLHAIHAVRPDGRFHIVTVPRGSPQTKPRACNYALRFVRGEYVTIYDAEDAPEVMQLRKAASIFAAHPDIACLQARLNYYNTRENWLTSLFAIEYTGLFDVMLPALYALNIPIPLGGTSNHLRLDVLHDVGAWDAFNVTEDADLGMRLACKRYRTLPISSLTMEEAPLHIWAWIKQRTRWIKGYIQTWRVMHRHHALQWQHWGVRGWLGMHCFVGGGSVAYSVTLPALLLLAIGSWMPDMLPMLPAWMKMASALLLLGTCLVQWGCAWQVRRFAPRPFLWGALLLYPFYFLLHGIAGVRAVWHVMVAPYVWEKTTHHLSRIRRFDA
jgi:cellulose synthase/poly-beta-1,6-N-acetylglucosamine synthase-like glycosyltransferase